MTIPHNHFAARLRMLRSQRPDISQDKLADAVGVSQNAIGKWERGESLPRVDALCKICKVYEVSADYLIGISSTPSSIPPDWWIVDLDHVEAVKAVQTAQDLAKVESEDGTVPIGFPIPSRPAVMSSRDYADLRAECEVALQRVRRKGRR